MHETRRKQTTSWLILACALTGCGAAVDSPNVDFGVSKPVGRWEMESAQARIGDASVEVVKSNELGASGSRAVTSGSATVPTSSSMSSAPSKPSGGAAGRNSTPAANGGNGGNGGTGGTGGASTEPMGAAAGSGGDSKPADDKPTAVTSLAFNFTTEPVGGRYKPKNIGAVWISDSSGKLIKSLEVWAFLRLRYLTKYAGVRGSNRPDVTTSATLPNHSKPHTATWDLKDTTGAAVPPGKYTLNAEITDQDATGKAITVDFDTSTGPMTLTPAVSTGFAKLEVVLK